MPLHSSLIVKIGHCPYCGEKLMERKGNPHNTLVCPSCGYMEVEIF